MGVKKKSYNEIGNISNHTKKITKNSKHKDKDIKLENNIKDNHAVSNAEIEDEKLSKYLEEKLKIANNKDKQRKLMNDIKNNEFSEDPELIDILDEILTKKDASTTNNIIRNNLLSHDDGAMESKTESNNNTKIKLNCKEQKNDISNTLANELNDLVSYNENTADISNNKLHNKTIFNFQTSINHSNCTKITQNKINTNTFKMQEYLNNNKVDNVDDKMNKVEDNRDYEFGRIIDDDISNSVASLFITFYSLASNLSITNSIDTYTQIFENMKNAVKKLQITYIKHQNIAQILFNWHQQVSKKFSSYFFKNILKTDLEYCLCYMIFISTISKKFSKIYLYNLVTDYLSFFKTITMCTTESELEFDKIMNGFSSYLCLIKIGIINIEFTIHLYSIFMVSVFKIYSTRILPFLEKQINILLIDNIIDEHLHTNLKSCLSNSYEHIDGVLIDEQHENIDNKIKNYQKVMAQIDVLLKKFEEKFVKSTFVNYINISDIDECFEHMNKQKIYLKIFKVEKSKNEIIKIDECDRLIDSVAKKLELKSILEKKLLTIILLNETFNISIEKIVRLLNKNKDYEILCKLIIKCIINEKQYNELYEKITIEMAKNPSLYVRKKFLKALDLAFNFYSNDMNNKKDYNNLNIFINALYNKNLLRKQLFDKLVTK